MSLFPSRNIFSLQLPPVQKTPLVLDAPHSGLIFPEPYKPEYDLAQLTCWVDVWVDELWDFAPSYGIPLLASKIHRCFIDLNRHIYDVDPKILPNHQLALEPKARTLEIGNGLLKRIGPNGEAIFDDFITEAELLHILASYYHPYHGALRDMIRQTLGRFGKAYHLNCHAMMAVNRSTNEVRPDVVLSNQRGDTADNAALNALAQIFEMHGFSVKLNDPFLGGEIVQRFGNPEGNVHSIQIELNKSLYSEETQNFAKSKNFYATQERLQQVLLQFADWVK